MPRDAASYLWDAEGAAKLALEFMAGRRVADLDSDVMLRSALERQIQIVGEALSQLARLEPAYGSRIPDLPRIVALRNILVHGYAVVDHERLWDISSEELPALRRLLQQLLDEVTS
ncbi:MAG: DUF86 domain-containing protein [Geodermatophilaceae bacterium]|nr:DUF86 domain-containing protein [Geodermatophilaceae bacterium]